MARKTPEILDLDADRVEELLRRAEDQAFDATDYQTIRVLVESYAYLTSMLGDKNTTITRLRKLLFGTSSEKTEKVVGDQKDSAPPTATTVGDVRGECVDPNDNRATDEASSPGHGRYGADDYPGANQVDVRHPTLSAGDDCPECHQGTLYENIPSVLVRFVGRTPLQATVYRLQKLRCHLCGKVFTASAPAGVGEEKYDHTVASMIGLLKYGSGLPFNRIERLQGNCEIPLAASTQWGIVSAAAGLVAGAYEELIRQAAQGDVVHNDDTTVKILELMGKRADKSPPSDDPHDPRRTGLFTSGVIATRAGIRIALFFSGRRHAGENLMAVLKHRAAELDAPIHMCDGLARNLPKELDTILANCLAHGRRNFVELHDRFPDECRYVIEAFKVIYHNDKVTREEGLSADQRLSYHQAHSQPTVDSLKEWLERQFNERLVEPNSALGEAINYLLKRWDSLTLFLRKVGAPLDNNLCERALKKAILHRKNALFYKTRNGAGVGDIYMSLIYTCELNGASAFDYLNQLQLSAADVTKHPDRWMPWNYRDNLAARSLDSRRARRLVRHQSASG
jgi:transposase